MNILTRSPVEQLAAGRPLTLANVADGDNAGGLARGGVEIGVEQGLILNRVRHSARPPGQVVVDLIAADQERRDDRRGAVRGFRCLR